MTADHTDPAADDAAAARLRASLDAVTATTSVRPDWDDVTRRADGRGDLRLASSRRSQSPTGRPVLVAAAILLVSGLAAAVALTGGANEDPEEQVRSAQGLGDLRASARYAPDPLPEGWSVLSITHGETDLGVACPCRVGRWTDGAATVTYREAVHLPAPIVDPTAPGVPVHEGEGRTVQAGGERAWVRWVGDGYEAEAVVVGGAPDALGTGPVAELVRAFETNRGEWMGDPPGWTTASNGVATLRSDSEHTSSTTVRLAVTGGGTVSYRLQPTGVRTFDTDLDGATLEGSSSTVGPVLRLPLDPADTQGVVGTSLVLQADSADITASFGGGSVEPGRRDEAPRATEQDLRALVAALRQVDDAGWAVFTALAPDGADLPDDQAELAPETTKPRSGEQVPATVAELPSAPTPLPSLPTDRPTFTIDGPPAIVSGRSLEVDLRLANDTGHQLEGTGCFTALQWSLAPIDEEPRTPDLPPPGPCEQDVGAPGAELRHVLRFETTDDPDAEPTVFDAPSGVGLYRLEVSLRGTSTNATATVAVLPADCPPDGVVEGVSGRGWAVAAYEASLGDRDLVAVWDDGVLAPLDDARPAGAVLAVVHHGRVVGACRT